MKKICNPERKDWKEILKRPTKSVQDIEDTVAAVFADVKAGGDAKLRYYTQKFDGVALTDFAVPPADIKASKEALDPSLKSAIALAKQNISSFHKAQYTERLRVDTQPGVSCWQEKRPIQKVGLYIPGGTAPLFSTILMLALPAQIAGCEEIVLCTPPDKDGKVHPAILYTAALCGVERIFKVGGIQAIAAMTFGTESIPQVYKIFGPGNQYVTVAKQLATKYNVAIDMPAGPSELLVVADDSANPSFVASDLLSQAEHGVDSQVILISTSEAFMDKVAQAVAQQLPELPRKDIAEKAMANSKMILVENDRIAVDIINDYGPEHYIICMANEEYYIEHAANAGSVFIGDYTPESAGDYASGTNHTLPTNGYAKQYSGVNLDSFLKQMTFQKISADGLRTIGPAIEAMAEAEGLFAHKNAVSLRLKALGEETDNESLTL